MVDSSKIEPTIIMKKVVLLGNSEVGKTSIFNRVISGNYFEDGVASSSAYFRSKEMTFADFPNTVLRINLWDTAGQEKFHSLTEMYVRDASGILVVYDMTRIESFEGVLTWHRMVEQHLDQSKIVLALVGNKCDNDEMLQVKL